MSERTTIPIFFTIDDKFPFYLDCAIRSIMDNASPAYDYRFHILYEHLTDEDMENIRSAVRPPYEIEFMQLEEGFKGITNRPENYLRCDYFTLSIFYRIFLGDLFPQYDKGIYLDADVIVPGDISEMYEKDLAGNIIGACPDLSIVGLPTFVAAFEQAVGVPIDQYINSGVLLLDLKQMREVSFGEHFLNLLNTYHFETITPDQDYINAMCYGKVLFLGEEWDAMPPADGKRPILSDPKLIHYNLFRKPWLYDDIPYGDYFWKYAKESPFYQQILDCKAGYSDEEKEHDQKTLEVMETHAAKVAGNEVTFQKMYESGADIRI